MKTKCYHWLQVLFLITNLTVNNLTVNAEIKLKNQANKILNSEALEKNAGDGSLLDTNIQFIGRWDKSNANMFQSNWGGAYFRVKFTGKSISINLAASTELVVIIDGEAPRLMHGNQGLTKLNIATLTDSVHTLLIGSSGQEYEVSFLGLVLDEGAVTYRPDSKFLIEYIGDSITAGTGSGSVVSTVNFAWNTAELLGCDHTQIAFSGLALATGYGCLNVKIGLDSLYFLFKNYNHVKEIPLKKWDFSYIPDIVYIALGTNDNCGSETEAVFYKNALKFFQRLRFNYPHAKIIVQRPLNGIYKVPLSQVVQLMNTSGDANISYIDTNGWLNSASDYSDGVHPNAQGGKKIVDHLLPIIKPMLNELASEIISPKEDKLSLYPNPVKDILKITSDQLIKNLTVQNSIGVSFESLSINNTSTSTNLSKLNAGLYFIKVTYENGNSKTIKIIKL